MIHRAPFGSLERLIGILIEEYKGDFPLWLAPVQLRLLPVNEAHLEYAQEVALKMRTEGLRIEVDSSTERLPKKIRNAELKKIPIMAIVGAKEVESNGLSIRTRSSGDLGLLTVPEVITKMKEAIATFNSGIA
jgi:threonyl-tRNA synthetase